MTETSSGDLFRVLWQEQRYMEAFATAWRMPPVYNYHWLMPQGGGITLRELILRSCQQALLLAAQDEESRARAEMWVETCLSAWPPPPALIDQSDGAEAEAYRAQLIRAHLECVRIGLTMEPEHPWPCAALSPLAQSLGLPPGLLRDLLSVLLAPSSNRPTLHQPEHSVQLTTLLVGATRGIAATLTLAYVPNGTGALYPTPSLAFVHRDAAFRQAEATACAWAELPSRQCDVRWDLRRLDGQPFGALTGPSLGVALALGLAKVIGSLDEHVDLELVAVTAALAADGALRPIGGVWKKLGEHTMDLARRGLLHAVVVAAEQDDVPPAYLREEATPLRVLKAATITDALQQIHTHLFPRHAVWQYERAQCRRVEVLGKLAPMAHHYQPLPLVREVTRAQWPRQDTAPRKDVPPQEKDALDDTLDTSARLQREEAWQTFFMVSEAWSFDQVFQQFQDVAPEATSPVPRFVVLGPPGSGKTTLLHYLAWRAAHKELRFLDRPLLPVRVRLREWEAWLTAPGHAAQGLSEYLSNKYADLPRAPTASQWRRALQHGEVLLLWDGLDEIERRPLFLSTLTSTLALFPTCPTILTCRTVSFEQHRALCPDFAVLTLAGLDDQQRDAYVQTFPATHPETYDPRAFLMQLRQTSSLRALTANPLLLSVLCSVRDRSPTLALPRTRSGLYQQMLESLLAYRVQRVEPHYPGGGLGIADQLALLPQLALHCFSLNEPHFLFSAQAVRHALIQAFRREAYGQDAAALWAQAFLTDLTENSGILHGTPEQGFCFFHPTVHEFLVAAALGSLINQQGWSAMVDVLGVRVSIRQLVHHKAWDPRWQEVLVFLAGQLNNPLPLVRLLAEETHDDLFRHRLVLAAVCLAEAQTRIPPATALVGQLTTAVLSMWMAHAHTETLPAVEHLVHAWSSLAAVNGHIEGLPLSQWLHRQTHSPQDALRARAASIVGWMGVGVVQYPEVLTALARMLRDPQVSVRAQALQACERLGTLVGECPEVVSAVTQLTLTEESRWLQVWATRVVQRLTRSSGSSPDPPIPLTPLPPRVPVQHRLGRSAGERLEETPPLCALSVLLPALQQPEQRTRAHALQEIGERVPEVAQHPDAVTAVLQSALHDSDAGIRFQATAVLRRLTAYPPLADRLLPPLSKLLRDRDTGVRAQAAQALGALGKATVPQREALSELLTALQDHDVDVRVRAAEAVGQLQKEGVRVFQRWWKIQGYTVEALSALRR